MNKNSLNLFIYIFMIKILYSLFGVFVFSQYSQLGDSQYYLRSNADFSLYAFVNSTVMMIFICDILQSVFGDLGTHLLFCLANIFGLYYFLNTIEPQKRELRLIRFIILLPSVSMWTSIVSKETMISIGMYLVGTYCVSYLGGKRKSFLLLISGLLLVFLFKKLFLFPLVIFVSGVVMMKSMQNSITITSVFFSSFSLAAAILVVTFENSITSIFETIPDFFDNSEGTVRDFIKWDQPYGFLIYAPIGSLMAFWGPTFSEVIAEPLKIVFFLESLFLIILMISLVIPFMLSIFNTCRVKLFRVCLLAVSLSAFIAILYPYGAINGGSALRYRSAIIPIMLLILVLFNRSKVVPKEK